jgi:hypothetical protein
MEVREMRASAKFTACVLVAGWALGTALFSGCTTGSSTDNNTDGGFQPPVDRDTGTPTDPDTGAPAPTCTTSRDPAKPIRNATCQACLDGKCCTLQQTCFQIQGDTGAGTVGCGDYHECIDNCIDTDGGSTCEEDCDLTAAAGVIDAYGAIAECGNTNCVAECD